jgi:hypothetical protein
MLAKKIKKIVISCACAAFLVAGFSLVASAVSTYNITPNSIPCNSRMYYWGTGTGMPISYNQGYYCTVSFVKSSGSTQAQPCWYAYGNRNGSTDGSLLNCTGPTTTQPWSIYNRTPGTVDSDRAILANTDSVTIYVGSGYISYPIS